MVAQINSIKFYVLSFMKDYKISCEIDWMYWFQVSAIVSCLLGPERAKKIQIFAGDVVPKKKPDPVNFRSPLCL